MVGPVLFSQVFARAIDRNAALHAPGAPYLLAAVLIAASVVVTASVLRARTRG
jgi:hypothetical protein